jgi:hypothetical protein
MVVSGKLRAFTKDIKYSSLRRDSNTRSKPHATGVRYSLVDPCTIHNTWRKMTWTVHIEIDHDGCIIIYHNDHSYHPFIISLCLSCFLFLSFSPSFTLISFAVSFVVSLPPLLRLCFVQPWIKSPLWHFHISPATRMSCLTKHKSSGEVTIMKGGTTRASVVVLSRRTN